MLRIGMLFYLPGGKWPLLAAIFAILTVVVVVRWKKYPTAPGPWLARFTNVWQAYKMAQGHFEAENIELHRSHGKIVRLGPSYYSIDDSHASKIIYGHGTKFVKADWYRAWQLPLEFLEINLFAQQDIKQHSNARRKYASLYSMSSLVGYEPGVDKCINIFSNALTNYAQTGERVDLASLFQHYAFDVIGEITYSKRFGFMESRKDIGNMISTIGLILEAQQLIGLFPPVLSLQIFLTSIFDGKGTNRVLAFAEERIKEAKQAVLHGHHENPDPEGRQDTAAPDFCSKLISLNEGYGNDKKTGLEADILVIGACTQNVFAGSDTTSITLNAALFNIITRPEVLSTLRAELDEAGRRGELSDPPEFAEAQKLPYLQAVLKESLRLHPATGLPLWREVPAGGATLCGRYFPAGTSVGVNSWVAHRNRDTWGEDADEFRPERWINSNEDQLREMNAMFMPFGLGSRTCIGKNISLLEISKLIPLIVRKFDIVLSRPVEAGKKTELASRCTWFVKQKEFPVIIKKRVGY